MTVSELIAKLSHFDSNARVVLFIEGQTPGETSDFYEVDKILKCKIEGCVWIDALPVDPVR